MDTWFQDLRFALRTLRKSVFVTLIASGSLALAIAGNIVVFALINGLFFRPLPYPEAEEITLVGENEKENALPGSLLPSSVANYLDWRERQTSFETLAGFRGAPVNLTGGERAEQLNGAAVTPSFFPMLGANPSLGRVFTAEEEIPGNHRVALVTQQLWERRFGSDQGIVGESIELNGEPHTVVGVLPAEFEFFDPTIEIWLPLAPDRATLERAQRDMIVVGRLADGITTERARSEMVTLAGQLEDEYPDTNRGYTVSVVNMRDEVPDSRNRVLFAILQGALILVLFIACANIANLLLARSQKRGREIAVRASLGASQARIMRQLFTESLLMATLAGIAGLGLAFLGIGAVAHALAKQLPAAYAPVVDQNVILFTVAVTLLGAVLFGLAPVLQSFKLDLASSLKDRAGTASGRRRLLASGLVVAEIFMALVMLGGAGVLIRSFLEIQNRDPGFETANVLTLQIALPEARYGEDEAKVDAVDRLQERFEGIAGVRQATAGSTLPRSPFLPFETFTIDARPPADDQSPPRTTWMSVPPSFFDTVGIPLQRGRLPEPTDRAESDPVVVINQSMAETFWPEEDPVGQRLTMLGTSRQIIGVVGDVRHGILINEKFNPAAYVPFAQLPVSNVAFSLRTDLAPEQLTEVVREEVLAFDPGLAAAQVQTLDDFMAQFYVGMNLFTTILGAFGALALFLAALGTYGVLAYTVAQRTREIGVRMAMGASRWQVVRMVTQQGLRLAVIGIVLGIPGVLGLTQVINSQLGDLAPVEPTSLIGIAVMLAVVTLFASLLPARRAASVDPVQALASE